MRSSRAHISLLLLIFWLGAIGELRAQENSETPAQPPPQETQPLEIESPDISAYDPRTGNWYLTNFTLRYSGTVMTAHQATVETNSGNIFANGSVRIQKEDQAWIGEHLTYNYLNGVISGNAFRTGKAPAYAAGQGLTGETTNHVYTATNAYVTADDYYNPLLRVHARKLKIVPGKYFEATGATLYIGHVPVFYFPYYRKSLEPNSDRFTVLPGYRSVFGPFLLGRYDWYYNEYLRGAVHMDYRERRGFGAGPDFLFHLTDGDEGVLRYYYTHDHGVGIDNSPVPLPENRQRVFFTYQGEIRTNLTVKSQAVWWSDPYVTHDFFESEFRKDVQPPTYFDVEQAWRNWSLEAEAQPRVIDFFDTVERLPDIHLTGFRQQLGNTPFYYDSETSAGWYRRLFANTNFVNQPYSAGRADTFHQITMPENFFGWLNFTPRAGERLTHYSEAEGAGAATTEQDRAVFNTGAELSTKLSRTWPGYQNDFLEMDGARHIMEPSVNYVYVPRPSTPPSRLPQFDSDPTNSLYLVPIEFPDYNAIDSVDSMNVIRWGLLNRIQTKRQGQIDDLINWSLFLDWRLQPNSGQNTFSDIFSDLQFKPRSWLVLGSTTRYNIEDGKFDLAQHQLTLRPNNVWSWSLGHFYLRGGTIFGNSQNLFTSTFYYRLNDNWGTRISHQFDANSGRLQEQYYTLYRDLRSWTGALTFRVTDDILHGEDYTIAATFSLKAFPHYALGQDAVTPANLIGE